MTVIKLAIIHISVHHHNTYKVAEARGVATGGTVLTVDEAKKVDLSEYALVGFGSGIFFSSHHPALLRFVREHDTIPNKVFLFSTAGLPSLHWIWHRLLRKALQKKGIQILGEASYPGWDTVGLLRWIGGIQRGHPNEKDVSAATQFALRMAASTPTESSLA
ncbi:MAG: flavodoxin [Planctomycetes bacterium]|nr:flavodoxin [Planctomycetota bacterium]